MLKDLIKVFGETVIYGVTGVASTLASVFLVPFYTRVLTPADYGISALLGTLFSIIVVVANLGMATAIFRFYFRAKKESKGDLAGTAFISQTIFPFVVAAITFVLSDFISRTLFGSEGSSFLIKLSAAGLFFNAGVMVPLAILRAEGKPANYVSVNVIKLVSTIGLSILLVVVLRWGLLGVFWANLGGAALGYLAGLIYALSRIKFVFSTYWITEMLRFGLPLVPAGLAMWVLNSSDRYFLNHFATTADVGIYNVGYRVGSLVTLVTGALQLAAPRFIFSIYHEKPGDAKYYFKKINTYFYLINFTFALLISVFAKEAIQILTGPDFHSAHIVVPLVAFSYVAYGLYQNFGTGVSVVNKTYLSALAVLIGGVVNLNLNYLFISRFGMMGAALATFLSFCLLAFVELYFSQRVYRIYFEFGRLFKISVIGGLIAYLSTVINFGLFWSIVIKFSLVISFPIFLYLFRFLDERELRKIKSIWIKIKSVRGNPGAILESLKQELIT